MKNKEKFSKEIVELACDGKSVAIDKRTGKIGSCDDISCSNCLFDEKRDCNKTKKEWAESEYIEKPVISNRDRELLEYIHKRFKSIARDKDGKIYIFTDIAKKDKNIGAFTTNGLYRNVSDCFDIEFPMVKWEDDKPWLIDDLKKLEVVDSYE